eukprot:GHUV01034385.1.p1 GENE.GHUV01034385.1~~GHUV01034385.1.p1  ORF type:complete len:273 (+),score=76.91 GHUV01034385.1:169-987(+)
MCLLCVIPALRRWSSAIGSVLHHSISGMQQLRCCCHECRILNTMQLGSITLQHSPQLKGRDQHSHYSTAGATAAVTLAFPMPLLHPGLVLFEASLPGPPNLDRSWVTHISSVTGQGLEVASWTATGAITTQRHCSTSRRPSPSRSSWASARESGLQPTAAGLQGMQPKQLTAHIMQCTTTQQLQELVLQYSSSMNDINLAAVLKRLQLLNKQWGSSHCQTDALLHKLWDLIQPQLDVLRARELSSVIWCLGQILGSNGAAAGRQPGTNTTQW